MREEEWELGRRRRRGSEGGGGVGVREEEEEREGMRDREEERKVKEERTPNGIGVLPPHDRIERPHYTQNQTWLDIFMLPGQRRG